MDIPTDLRETSLAALVIQTLGLEGDERLETELERAAPVARIGSSSRYRSAPTRECDMLHRFGDYEIDEMLFEVRRSGVVLAVAPKVFDILVVLIKNRHRVVTKEELLTSVWAGAKVTEDALNQTIRRARRILEAPGAARPAIVTVRGRGYRLLEPRLPGSIDRALSASGSLDGLDEESA